LKGKVTIQIVVEMDASTALTRNNNLGQVLDELSASAARQVKETLEKSGASSVFLKSANVLDAQITAKDSWGL
jgi:hypothetical protein